MYRTRTTDGGSESPPGGARATVSDSFAVDGNRSSRRLGTREEKRGQLIHSVGLPRSRLLAMSRLKAGMRGQGTEGLVVKDPAVANDAHAEVEVMLGKTMFADKVRCVHNDDCPTGAHRL